MSQFHHNTHSYISEDGVQTRADVQVKLPSFSIHYSENWPHADRSQCHSRTTHFMKLHCVILRSAHTAYLRFVQTPLGDRGHRAFSI
jgi:hypothetical protein